MRKADELIIEHSIFPQTTYRHCHTAFNVTIQLCLRTVIFLEIVNELLRSRRQFQFLRYALEVFPDLQDFFLGRLLLKGYEYSGSMTV